MILTGKSDQADDLAQETFIKAYKAMDRGQFRPGTDIVAWLATILRHTRIDRLRSGRAAAGNVSLDELSDVAGDLADTGETQYPDWHNPQDILSAFGDQEIIDALTTLPEDIRWTLLLVDVQGMDHKDAAVVLDIPVGTVKSRVHRGRTMLRQTLEPLAKERRLMRGGKGAAIED